MTKPSSTDVIVMTILQVDILGVIVIFCQLLNEEIDMFTE